MTLHVEILRSGARYRGAETAPVPDVRDGEARAIVSLANPGLIRRDVARWRDGARALAEMSTAERISRTIAAADLFRHAELPVGDALIGWEGWVELTSASTGLPHPLVRRNGAKVESSLRHADQVVRGLSRGLPPALLDTGWGEVEGLLLGLVQVVRTLGAVLPSNSPGVHTLWTPAPALGVALALKPGRGDPWTPQRVLAALTAAGLPASAFSLYPSAHDGGAAVIEAAERVMVFGGEATVRAHRGDPRVEVHGPGFSKVICGPDVDPLALLDELEQGVVSNGGRSCINTSTILVPAGLGPRVAAALAERLARHAPRALDDPEATLAAFADRAQASAIDAALDQRLDGAVDHTAPWRSARRVERDGLVYLLPTVVSCPPEHPLARTELPFPFVAVVEYGAPGELAAALGPTLVASVWSDEPALWDAVRRCVTVDRLHRGVGTMGIRWDQPHEGNLFDACWRRRGVAA